MSLSVLGQPKVEAATDTETPPSCTSAGGGDDSMRFTAPATHTFDINKDSTDYDFDLHARDAHGGTELDCNDDTDGLWSGITLDMLAGETVGAEE